jgi:hypothetical protein
MKYRTKKELHVAIM